MAVVTVPGPRVITLGNAPTAQTGAGGQWATAWSLTGVSAVQKADAGNTAEAWTAVKYTDLLSTTLAGGDISKGDLGVSGQSAATSTVKQEIDGKEALRFNLAEAAQAVTLNLSSFFAADDGSAYAEGARVRVFDGGGNLVGETFVTANSLGGNQLVELNSAQAFRSVEISAGARKGDGSFSYGAYNNGDGSFGSEIYTAGTKHGSDFLLDGISFTLARPAAAADSYVLDEDAPLTHFANVLANDTDANGAPLSAVLETGPAHGTLTLNADGSFSYQADANYHGADSFTYRANNGKDFSEAATVHLKINPVNDAPVARNDSATTNEDTVVGGNVLNGSSGGLDTDVDGDALMLLTTGAFTTTLGAIVTLSANGNYSYNPTGSSVLQSMAEGAVRVDGFDYTVSDGHGGTSTAHVEVTVQGREDGGGTLLLPSVAPGTDLTYYMRYTASGGASEWLEIDAVTLGMSSAVTAGKGGTQLGKAVPDDVVLNLGAGGKAMSELTARLLTGTIVDSVEIEAYVGSGKGKSLVQEYKFSDALVTSAQTGVDGVGNTGNTLAFTYGALDQVLTPYGKDGRPTTAQNFSWNVPQGDAKIDSNEKVDPGADAVVGGAGAEPSTLDYFIHIDGLAGWIPLGEFKLGYSADSSYLKGVPVTGKPVASELTLGLGNSELLTTLFKNELAGRGATIEVEAYTRMGQTGEYKLVDEYVFNKAYTTGLDSSGNSNTLNVLYNSFTHSHLAYDNSGKADKANAVAIGYDFVAHKNLPAPGADPEALEGNLSPYLPQGAELTYYMRYTDNGVSKWMEIEGFTFGVDTPVTALKGVSQTGEPVAQTFTMELGSGKAMTDFQARLLSGTTISNVEIEAYSNGFNGPQLRQELRFTDALITSVQTGADNGATSNTLSFVYQTVDQATIPFRDDGKPLTAIKVGWDFENNTATLPTDAIVDPGADVDLNALAPLDDTSTPLDYYIHIEGVDGWVELSSFMLGYTADPSSTKGGTAAGKPVASEVSLELGLSQVLNTLLKNEFTGASATIQVEAYLPGDKTNPAKLVDEYIFTGAVASEVHSSTFANNDVSLAYSGFTHSHLVYRTDGKLDTANSSSVGFNFLANTKLNVPTVNAEATTKAPLPTVPQDSDLTYYMRYTDGGVSKWMEIDAFSFGVDAEVVVTKGAGMTVDEPQQEAFTIQLGTGKALADFTLNLLTGSDIGTIEIEAHTRTQDAPVVVQEYRLTKAYVTGVETAAGSDGTTINTLNFTYGTVDHAVSAVGQDGKLTKAVAASYDFERETTTIPSQALVDPGLDATPNQLMPQYPTGASLAYYIHVNGVEGWVALSSFSLDYTANSIVDNAGGAIGKPTHSPLTVELGLNQVLTTLMKNEVSGTPLTIQVEAYTNRGNDGPQLVDEYIFSKVYTTGVDSDGSANEVNLAYDAFTHKHLAYDNRGKFDSASSTGVGYDFAQAKVIGVPDASPDLFP